jgi:ATP-grasp N-terminal domain/Phosphoribosylglycinamide synthetase, ATP-grasp (A) domain
LRGLPAETRRIVFVSRHLVGESLRMARAIKKLAGVVLFGVCEQLPVDTDMPVFADLIRLADAHDPDQLIAAAHRLTEKHGGVDRIVTATETLLYPVALASQSLGLGGMSVSTVRQALDKSWLKATLARAGVNTARDQVLTSSEAARQFVAHVGFPIVLKPPGGSGALATLCIRSAEQLEMALELMQPTPESRLLAEAHLSGQELCIDTITIANEPQVYSICCYSPSILEAVEDPQIQWTCVMPRDITGQRYRKFIEQGLKAVRALSVGNAMTHMEGFMKDDLEPCFTDATLRPAGARIGPMLAFAYDIDPYLAWARVAVDGCFEGPWERRYAVGTIFLRGIGSGRVEQVEGLESVSQQVGELLVESRLPRVGAARSATYTGDGYITIRHPETQVVEEALNWIKQTVHITYTHPQSDGSSSAALRGQWSQRLQGFDKQLNKPAWDDDSLPSLNHA